MGYRLKMISGIVLIVMAAGGFVFWEQYGREAVLSEKVMVACADLAPGTRLRKHLFKEAAVPSGLKVDGAVQPWDFQEISGEKAKGWILKNEQLSRKKAVKGSDGPDPGTTPFVLKEEWIFTASSALRKGDRVDIYGAEGRLLLSGKQLAFVKDGQGKEVAGDPEKPESLPILDRTSESGVPVCFEVLVTPDEYRMLTAYVFDSGSALPAGAGTEGGYAETGEKAGSGDGGAGEERLRAGKQRLVLVYRENED